MDKFFKHPWVIVAVIAVITVFFAAQLPRAQLNNDAKSMLPDDNPSIVTSDWLDETFGKSEAVFIGLERPYGTVFDGAFLTRIRQFQDAVEEIDIVKNVVSILTMPYITADGDSIYVADLVDEDFSGTPAEIAELKRRLASWELYDGQTVSADLSATQVVVELNTSPDDAMKPEVQAGISRVRALTLEMFDGFADVYITGDPIVRQLSDESMKIDLRNLIPLVILVILAVLFFSFHHFTYIVLPLLTVILSVVWAIGAMPLVGVKMTVVSIIMPIILIAVGSAYGIHVVSHYIDETKHKMLSREEHKALVFDVLRKVIKPVLLAALTTMAGFISFLFTFLKPLKEFGAFSTLGVAAAVVISLTLIPALLLIRGPRIYKQKKVKTESRFGAALGDVLTVVSHKRAAVIMISTLVLGVSIYGMTKLVVESSMVEFFRPETDVYQSDVFIRKYFGGTTQITVAVEADTTERLLSPDVLCAVDNLNTYLSERVPGVHKVTGFTDMVKRMNQMFNVDESPEGIAAGVDNRESGIESSQEFGFGDFDDFGGFGFDDADDDGGVAGVSPAEGVGVNAAGIEAEGETSPSLITMDMLESAVAKNAGMSARDVLREMQRVTNYEGRAYYEIPSDPARYGKTNDAELEQLIANYLVLVGGDNDGGYSNDPLEPTAIRSVIQVQSKWWADTKAVIEKVNAYIAANFPADVRVIVGGSAAVIGELSTSVVNSQVVSIVISILVVILILALANKSIVAGILGAAPLSIAIVCNFGLMGFLGITLNVGTALVSSLAVGIGIDYTIHFMEFFKREYQAGGDYVHRTFAGCGKAILINAVSVGAGFAVLALSQFRMISHLGGLIASSMFISAILSLTLMPVLFMVFKPRFIFGKQARSA